MIYKYKRLCQKTAIRPLLELKQPPLSSIFVQQVTECSR